MFYLPWVIVVALALLWRRRHRELLAHLDDLQLANTLLRDEVVALLRQQHHHYPLPPHNPPSL